MTVPSGRAGSGARSVLRAVFCGAFAIVGLVAGGCGNTTFNYGTVVLTVSADPGPFTAYVADITGIALVQSNGSYALSYSNGFGKTVDFAKLGDTIEVFGAPAVVEGTYTSATITLNYAAGVSANGIASQIFVDVNGQSQAATLVDPTSTTAGTAPSSVSYTVKFDPAQPLVVSGSKAAHLDLHFDMNASSTVDTTTSPVTVSVRPFLTASTLPVLNKPLHTRGEFVTVDKTGGNFTINSVSFFDSPSYSTAPLGAIQVQPTDQTTYNVNGSVYKGAAGLTALNALPINAIIEAYGSPGDLTGQKPIINATEVYAGVAAENVLQARLTGTVVSSAGNTLHIHNAELAAPDNLIVTAYGITTPSHVLVKFFNDVAVTVDGNTLVTVDRRPDIASSLALISVGQQVELTGKLNVDGAGTTSVDSTGASGGLVRLTPTTAWGAIKTAVPGTATVNLLALGGAKPVALTFAGTGSDSTNYKINTGTVDLTADAGSTTPWRFDGTVTPFGSAPPDFTATAETAGTSTEQVLEIDWTSPGTTAPFLSQSSSGLVVNIANTSLGTYHVIRTGPAPPIDLKALGVSPTIVADGTVTGQFSIGNSATTATTPTGINVFHTPGAYLTQLNSVINGTNTVQKIVAVGHASSDNKTFTAYRIDILQLP
jgi:hypothetical protein